jgi:hypothetical protein
MACSWPKGSSGETWNQPALMLLGQRTSLPLSLFRMRLNKDLLSITRSTIIFKKNFFFFSWTLMSIKILPNRRLDAAHLTKLFFFFFLIIRTVHGAVWGEFQPFCPHPQTSWFWNPLLVALPIYSVTTGLWFGGRGCGAGEKLRGKIAAWEIKKVRLNT